MDLVSWRSAKGTDFQFVHFIDEGTLFHLGAECSQGAEGVIELFEQRWVSWAGQPREVYVDPGGEFVSDAFAANSLCRAGGYSPQQAVLGISPRPPGSILSDDDAASHSLAESGTAERGRLSS